jgi:hypothetical protein
MNAKGKQPKPRLPKKTTHKTLGEGVYVHHGACKCYLCDTTHEMRYATPSPRAKENHR